MKTSISRDASDSARGSERHGSDRLRRGIALAALGLGLTAAAPVLAAELTTIDFLPAVQSIGQNARVQLVNLAAAPGRVGSPPDPCRVSVQFIDADGNDVGAGQSLSIARGHSATAEAPVFVRTGIPMTLRARVTVILRSGSPPDPCAALHGNYEVYDSQTLETKFVSPGAIRGFNPQPDPPGVVGR